MKFGILNLIPSYDIWWHTAELLTKNNCRFEAIAWYISVKIMSKVLKLGPALKELRVHLCQKSSSSQGVRYLLWISFERIGYVINSCRDFIEKHYVNIKTANPSFPILIRECSQVEPCLWARFGKWWQTNSFKLFIFIIDSNLI